MPPTDSPGAARAEAAVTLIDRLEPLAKAANQEPWVHMTTGSFVGQIRTCETFRHIADMPVLDDRPEDFAHIAAADPLTVLELCAHVRRLVADVATARERIEALEDHFDCHRARIELAEADVTRLVAERDDARADAAVTLCDRLEPLAKAATPKAMIEEIRDPETGIAHVANWRSCELYAKRERELHDAAHPQAVLELCAHVRRLVMENIGLQKANTLLMKGMESQEELRQQEKQDKREAVADRDDALRQLAELRDRPCAYCNPAYVRKMLGDPNKCISIGPDGPVTPTAGP